MIKLGFNEIQLILRGAQLLGCGGGGEISWGENLIKKAADRGYSFCIADPDELNDNSLIFIVGAVGGGVSPDELKKDDPRLCVSYFREKLEDLIISAVNELSNFLEKEPAGFIPSEIGAGNMAVTLLAASSMGKFVVDGDCCGRAKPEISISTTRIAGISPTPLAAVNAVGDVMILKKTPDDERAEDILRRFAVSSGGACLCARCPATMAEYRKGMIPRSFTRCKALGERLQRAGEEGTSITEAILQVETDARIIFRGKILRHELDKSGGFMTGWLRIFGEENFAGYKFDIWFKNEFLMGLLNNNPVSKAPDILLVFNERTKMGVSNWEDLGDKEGDLVTVLEIPAHPLWQTPRGKDTWQNFALYQFPPHVILNFICRRDACNTGYFISNEIWY